MSFGTPEWQPWVQDEESSLELLEHAYKAGINTWDTVCHSYQEYDLVCLADAFAGGYLFSW